MAGVTDYRQCSRPGCNSPAVATLRYNYRASRATVTPLGPGNDPHSWDLCSRHVARLTVPEGWELVHENFGASDLHGSTPGPGRGIADTSDFTDEEMQVLAEALESVGGGDFPGAAEPVAVHPPAPASRIIRRDDVPRPSGHHPSRGNLPHRVPPRHLRAVRDGE